MVVSEGRAILTAAAPLRQTVPDAPPPSAAHLIRKDPLADTLFVLFEAPEATASEADLARVEAVLAALPGLAQAFVLTPTAPVGDQPFAADGRGPALALEIDFADSAALTAALAAPGVLAGLAALPSLAGCRVSHQPMSRREFPVADAAFRLPPGGHPCTFLVQYPGTASDLAAWLDHYDANHPPIMVRFPGIRAVSTFRPSETWSSALPFARGTAMQRNKVVFDSGPALAAALASPVMAEMRADSTTFPPYAPRASHHPMDTRLVRPASR